jgi:hypothetical protein
MVPDLSAVVEDSARGFPDDLFQGSILELGARDQLVEVRHIGLMVLAIMILQGFLGICG